MRLPSLLLALAASVACTHSAAVNIRVLVASGPQLDLRLPVSAASTPATRPAYATQVQWTVASAGGHLVLSGQDSGSDRLYLPPAAGSSVTVNGVTYRGGVYLRLVGGQVQAINVLDLEDYLRGVVASEMPASWSPEALRAQAVIARTYAVAHLNPRGDYDLCATEACQVYPGLSRETPATDAAVRSTTAQVVSWQGQAAKTYFSSDSGGYTASSEEVWNAPEPYLLAQPDPASRGPRSAWQLSIPLSQVQAVAARFKVNVGRLQSVSVTRQSASGRPLEISFTGAGGAARLSGAEAGGFVRALGAYSTRVNIGGTDPLIIAGAGNGHGVGLSQYGAAGLASAGWNYLQILGFYYRGASISALQEAGLGQAPQLAVSTPLNVAGAELAARAPQLPAPRPDLARLLEPPGAL